MKMTKKNTSRMKQLTADLKKLGANSIEVGVFGSDDADMVMIAAVHEYGTEINVTPRMRGWFAANGYPLKKTTTKIVIPERSFLRSGYDENINDITRKVEQLLPNVLESKVNAQAFTNAIGLEFAGMIKKKMRDLRSPTNSGMTIERKKSSNPLIDTGRLVGSIRHEVK